MPKAKSQCEIGPLSATLIAMVISQSSDTVPVIDKERSRRRARRWAGVAILVLLIGASFRIGYFDARAEALFTAWSSAWTAAALWLLTDLRRWYWKVFFCLSVVGSFSAAAQGLGLWHSVCVEHRTSDDDSFSSDTFSYCLPSLGPSPEFR